MAHRILLFLPVLLFCLGASWNEREDATGDWGGLRTKLENQYGLHIDLDYSAESFGDRTTDDVTYRGGMDLILTLDTEKAGLWKNGTLYGYVQHTHGRGVSDELRFLMPVSNLESQSFSQVSELWLDQKIGERWKLRLGKQDVNYDIVNPRFFGNFVNSSFGVMPGIPMPSFPAPGFGAAVFYDASSWAQFRGGVFEGQPTIGSFLLSAFKEDAGVFTVAGVLLNQEREGHSSRQYQVGGWHHTGVDRSGVYGLMDWLVYESQRQDQSPQSVQFFIRGAWSPEISALPAEVTGYAGGGITFHGYTARDDTVGIGFGRAHTRVINETFLELFVKFRQIAWFTIEPDLQVYFRPEKHYVIFGLRTKLKL